MARQSSKKFKSRTQRVEFELHGPAAERVSLAGDFNNWDLDSLPMRKDARGTWKATVKLEPGRYEYRFCVDSIWHDDPNAQKRVDNPFGSQNCVKIVG